VHTVDVEASGSAIEGRQDHNPVRTLLERGGKKGGDQSEVGVVPVRLTTMKGRLHEDL
jgi:hypothetical protein